MLGLLSILGVVGRMSILGRIGAVLDGWVEVTDAVVKAEKLRRAEEEARLGLNREQEKWAKARYGAVETLLPFHIDPEDLPHPEAFAWATGDFVFTISEWTNLWNWIETKLHNVVSPEKLKTGIDGHWLLEVGRRRWADESTRSEAVRSAERVRQQTSP